MLLYGGTAELVGEAGHLLVVARVSLRHLTVCISRHIAGLLLKLLLISVHSHQFCVATDWLYGHY